MKFTVLVLVLANLILFAWLRWAQPGASGADRDLVPPATGGSALRLVVERNAANVSTAPPPPERCLTVGPMTSVAAAAALAARLGEAGLAARTLVRAQTIAGDYQVLAAGFVSEAAAARGAAKLRHSGLGNIAVVRNPQLGVALSLGQYGTIQQARERVVRVRKFGLQPQILAHAHTAPRWFLELPASASAARVVRTAGIGLRAGMCAGRAGTASGATATAAPAASAVAPATKGSGAP